MAASAIRLPLVRLRAGSLDDARLAELAAAGDERAFEAVYDRHHRALLAFCRHMLGSRDEGEDALQQTFLRAHRSLLAQGAPDELRPWLFAIARNRCLTMLAARKVAAVPVEDVEPVELVTDGLSAGVESRTDLRELLRDIARLPDDQRSALVLAEIGDLSHAEIAEVIEVPTAKVKALVHQARTRLIADRDARETPCADVREQLATARGGELRRGPLRRHLALCDGCRAYRDAVAEQRSALALVLPVLPSAGLKDTIFGALGGGGGGAAAAASGGGAAGAALSSGGTTAGLAAKSLGAKLAIGAALAGGAGGGAIAVEQVVSSPERPANAAPASARGLTPAGPASRGAGERASAGIVLTGGAGRQASERGLDRSEAAAERRRARAEDRAAAKQRRADAREQARKDRAADKQARTLDRDLGKQDRAAAKEQRTAARRERLAARPPRGRSGTRPPKPPTGGSNAGGNGTTQRPAGLPRAPAPAKVVPPKAVAPSTPVATPPPVPAADVVPADGKVDGGRSRGAETVAP